MISFTAKLLAWGLVRNRGRTVIMIVTVFCALSSYILLGTALSEMAEDVAQGMRSDWPFDVTVEGRVTPEQEASVRALRGASHVEAVRYCEVFVGPAVQKVLTVPGKNTALVIELEAGSLPMSDREIVMPALLADAYGFGVGDELRLVGQRPGDPPQDYRIAGVLSGKSRVLTMPLLTEAGMARIRPGENYLNHLLIQLDGKVDLDDFVSKLESLLPRTAIRVEQEAYENAQEGRSLSDSLVIALRGLILMITATSLGVLFYLSQRSGAYQTGVLRAIGVQRVWLLFPSICLTVLIFAIGFPLTALALPLIASQVGLQSSPVALLQSIYQDGGLYLLVGVLSTIAVNWQFLSLPVPRLLKDAW